jgi:hypothetical protein
MFAVALSRPPTKEERDRFARYIDLLAELHQAPAAEVARNIAVWKDVAHALFNVQEFVYIP